MLYIAKNLKLNATFDEYALFDTEMETKHVIEDIANNIDDIARENGYSFISPIKAQYMGFFNFKTIEKC